MATIGKKYIWRPTCTRNGFLEPDTTHSGYGQTVTVVSLGLAYPDVGEFLTADGRVYYGVTRDLEEIP